MSQRILFIAVIFAAMAVVTTGWKVYVDEMLREYQKDWGTLVKKLKFDPLVIGDHYTEQFFYNVSLKGGILYGMTNLVLPEGDNFRAELEYPIRVSGKIKFSELFASFEEVDILGNRNISVPNVEVKIKAVIDPMVEEQVLDVTTEIIHGKPEIISGGFISTGLNWAIDLLFKSILQDRVKEIIGQVTVSVLQDKNNDINGAMRLISPLAVEELLKKFEVAVACNLFDDNSGSPCNIHVTKYKSDAE